MKRRGFTLLDLMIVVTIIGILASIAIPSFGNYIMNSKKSEAKLNLNLIGKGALTFFFEEHAYNNGMVVRTREYPSRENAVRGKFLADQTPIGHMPYESGPGKVDGKGYFGQKHNPNDYKVHFDNVPWADLNFRITEPFYYTYNYQGNSDNMDDKNPQKLGKSRFAATASACLKKECRTKKECDSGYVLVGGPHGTISPILPNDDFNSPNAYNPQCGKALISDIKKKINFDNY